MNFVAHGYDKLCILLVLPCALNSCASVHVFCRCRLCVRCACVRACVRAPVCVCVILSQFFSAYKGLNQICLRHGRLSVGGSPSHQYSHGQRLLDILFHQHCIAMVTPFWSRDVFEEAYPKFISYQIKICMIFHNRTTTQEHRVISFTNQIFLTVLMCQFW